MDIGDRKQGSQRSKRASYLEAGWERGQARAGVPSAGQLHEQGSEQPLGSALSPKQNMLLLQLAEMHVFFLFANLPA